MGGLNTKMAASMPPPGAPATIPNTMAVATPDGRTLTLDGLTESLVGSWGFAFWLRSPEFHLRAESGVKGSAELTDVAQGTRISHSEQFSSGPLDISIDEFDERSSRITVSGSNHEVRVSVPGIGLNPESITDVLNFFNVSDSPEGCVIEPAAGLGASVELIVCFNTIEDVGGLSVTPPERVNDNTLPRGTGQAVPGGELWANNIRNAEGNTVRSTYVLDSEDATVELTYVDRSIETKQRALGVMRSLIARID